MSFFNYINLLKLTKQKKPIQMISYKDRTWCSHSHNCANSSCDRNLTGDEIEKALEWWGGLDFPICYVDFKTENCGYSQINADVQDELASL